MRATRRNTHNDWSMTMLVTIHTHDPEEIDAGDVLRALEDAGYYVESVEVLKR